MPDNKPQTVPANPTKAFFVGMLTRDIDLDAAILDLLDNCVDGVLRKLSEPELSEPNVKSTTNGKPYEGFHATIDFDENSFKIADNCGGIPKKLAKEHAFKMGSPDLERDKDIPTVGMYGIGMKRAIFKIGRSCTVTTRHKDEAYRVTISSEWLADDKDWRLPIEDLPAESLKEGTIIEIKNLHDPIASLFARRNTLFSNEFKKTVATHYSYIMQKGFQVAVNTSNIVPRQLVTKFASPDDDKKGQGIAPFIYEGTINDVEVNLIIGFYRDFPSPQEIQADQEGKSGDKQNAGWTVVCNDRVVIYCNKDMLTGWGEAGVPKYHSQFISIAGVVHFRSSDASKLPVNTTKRGIDAASQTFLTVKDIMREGLKLFTNFTNKWKSPTKERAAIAHNAETVDIFDVQKLIPDGDWSVVRREYGGRKFVPQLPMPTTINPNRMIRFSRPQKDIRAVSEFVLGNPDEPPSEVGGKCFDDMLAKVRRNQRA